MEQKNRQNKQFEYKSLEKSFKDVDTKSGIITGYFAAFDNIDSYGDMIIKGAFKKTIAERGPSGSDQVKHLFQHDNWSPIAKVLVLKEDKKGLYFESQCSKTQKAQDVLIQYAEGIYNEHSIGYRTIKEEVINDDKGDLLYFKLTEVKLWEGSTVTWGANPQTPFTGFKSEKKEDRIAELKKRMDRVTATLKIGELSDETLESAEIELLKLHEAYISLITDTPTQRVTDPPSRVDTLKGIAELLTIKSK